ncbi:hypothetical protein H4S07_003908 [Coemansia furcata]|uniref:Uncharacterized protein n=1 Tax=Coemansia furcata TaxID=417177 RepID=A0ACC1LDH0_9FUNG|nr:hypothetical protein H4S07_003908 [Coemansia furcata]
MQGPAGYVTKGVDDGHIVADLLHLLENVNGDDLASFLESEHRELLRLRDQVRVYKAAASELAGHLQHVFSAVGGLSALPLSPPTRSTLGQPTSPGLQAPVTPLSPSNSIRARSRYVIPLVRSPSSAPFKLQHVPSRPSFSLGSRDAAVQTDDDGLSGMVAELKHTVDEQRADIVDLELALKESRSQVRVLRKQLKDKELRQFAAASDCAGLRRTASIMAGTGSELLAHMRAAGNWPSADTMPTTETVSAQDGRLSGVPSESSVASASIRSSGSTTGRGGMRESGVTGALTGKHRPSAYINGWPMYAHAPPKHNGADKQQPLPANNSECSALATSVSGLSTPRASQLLPSAEPVAAPETSAPSPPQPQPQPPRTPSLFVSAVANTPRRIYSRLSNRLKKI